MRRALLITATLAVFAAPLSSVATAKTSKADKREARQECRDLRGDSKATRKAFKTEFHSFGACVKEKAAEAKAERKQAQRDCRDERSADRKAFEEQYGTNHNKRNAFGKCVSQKAHEDAEGEDAGS